MSLKSTLLLLCLLIATKAYSSSGQNRHLDLATKESLRQYVKESGIEVDKPTFHFLGYSSSRSSVHIDVQIFHASSPIDISINQLECRFNLNPEAECELVSVEPRCYYFAETGAYSVSDFATAREKIESALKLTEDEGSIQALKMWQSGQYILSRILFSRRGVSVAHEFACTKSPNLNCLKVSGELPNEP